MNKSGIVLSIERNKVCIMTPSGEFAKVKVKGESPALGEEYTGSIVPKLDIIKYTSIAASLLLVLFSSGAAYAYYTPVSSVVLDINPSVKVEANRWNRIIKSEPLNEDGKKVLENISIKNKSLDEGLNMVFQEAKKENFLTNNYEDNGNEVKLVISSKKDVPVDLSEFKKSADDANIELNITSNGKVTLEKAGKDLPPAAEIKKDNQNNSEAGPKDKDDKTKTNNSNNSKTNDKKDDKNTNSSQPSVKQSDNENNKDKSNNKSKENKGRDNEKSHKDK